MRKIQKKLFSIFLGILPIYAGIIAVYLFLSGKGDSDFLWHCKLGEQIIQNRAVPMTDTMSWIGREQGNVFTAHSWLFSVLFYGLTVVTRSTLLSGAIYCFAGALLLQSYLQRLLPKDSTILFLTATMTGYLCLNPRPQVFGYLLFVMTLDTLCELRRKENSKKLWLLPIIGSVWACYHGGTVLIFLGIVTYTAFLRMVPNFSFLRITHTIDGGFAGKIGQYGSYLVREFPKKVLPPILLSFLGVLCNPYGFRILTYGFLENNSQTKQFVGEWKSLVLRDVAFLAVIVILLSCLLSLKKGGELSLDKLGIVVCCIAAGLLYCRFYKYAFLSSLFLLPDSSLCSKEEGFPKKKELRYLIVFLTLSVLEIGNILYALTSVDWNKNPRQLEKELVVYLREQDFQRMYNTYDDGGALLYDDFPSFVDQRAAGKSLISDAILFERNELSKESNEDYIARYQFDAILIPYDRETKEGSPMKQYLDRSSEWEASLQTDSHIVYTPAG